MASRAPLPGSSLSGSTLVTTVNARFGTLFDASVMPLTSVGGTGDVVTATCDPALTAGLVPGMKFGITWGAANTGAVTLNINGGGAVSVLKATGAALTADELASGLRSLVEYHSGSFYLLSPSAGLAGEAGQRITFTSSGSWTVPTDLPSGTLILVRAWAAGGGGSTAIGGGGGGGGGFSEWWFDIDDLGSSVTVTVGAGGAAGATGGTGGNTTFGSFLSAFGGGGGSNSAGGRGGGEFENGPSGGYLGGGAGGTTAPDIPQDAASRHGGGGGGVGLQDGARAICGGGGGAGGSGGTGGVSVFGGNGGGNGVAGVAPGGGGGRNAPGARGQVEILIPR